MSPQFAVSVFGSLLKICRCGLLLVCLLQISSHAENLESLFADDGDSRVQTQAAPSHGARRERRARLNADFFSGDGALAPLRRFVFNLFPDLKPSVQIQHTETTPEGRRVSSGVVGGLPGSHFLLAEDAGSIAAAVFIPGKGSYKITSAGDSWYSIVEIDPEHPAVCGVDHQAPAPASNASSRAPSRHSFQAGIGAELEGSTEMVSILDVLVVYTPAALAGAGNLSGMNMLIDLAIAEANTVYQNSRANMRIRLAASALVQYTETDSITTNLTRLRNIGDGFMDEVHALRDTNRADLVCLITEKGEGNLAGLAFTLDDQISTFAPDAFSVVRRDSAVGQFIFAHEISHNLGCQHDRANATNSTGKVNRSIFPYSFGYKFTANGTLYRDVMSYAPGEPIPFFSNPQLLYFGVPMGEPGTDTGGSDNVRTINATASVAAGFRLPSVTTLPPTLSLLSPAENATFLSEDDITLTALALDVDGSVSRVEFYTNSMLAGVSTSGLLGSHQFRWTNTPPGDYTLAARAVDNLGATVATRSTRIVVRPKNDDFARRLALQGASFLFNAATRSGTTEPGEPSHSNNPGGRSVWYQWVAPRDGTVDLVVKGTVTTALADVYTGNTLNSLSSVARAIEFPPNQKLVKTAFDAVAGQTYAIAVDSFNGFSDEFNFAMSYQSRPANDDFGAGQALIGETFVFDASNVASTREEGEPAHDPQNTGGKSVWYRWTAPRDGAALLAVQGSEFFPLISVYTGNSLASLTRAEGFVRRYDIPNSGISAIFTVKANTVYHIAVEGNAGQAGPFSFALGYPPAPANDMFANRQLLSGSAISFTTTNSYATFEAGEPLHAQNEGGRSVWYEWTAPASGKVTVTVKGDRFFPLTDIYTGSAVSALERPPRSLAFNNTNFTSVLSFNAVALRTYALAVDGFTGLSGLFDFTLEAQNRPPAFQSTGAINQQTGAFSITLSGSPGTPFQIQGSTNLVQWFDVHSGTFPADTFLFSEPAGAGVGQRFYRVIPMP